MHHTVKPTLLNQPIKLKCTELCYNMEGHTLPTVFLLCFFIFAIRLPQYSLVKRRQVESTCIKEPLKQRILDQLSISRSKLTGWLT